MIKKIDFGTKSLLLSLRTTTIDLPECQERRWAKTTLSVFFEKASLAEGWRRLHKNTALAMFSRKAGPKVGVLGCFGVFLWCFGWGVLV